MNVSDIPVENKARDKAWQQFIARKDVQAYFKEQEFSFPLERGYYELWCQCWAKAWQEGFDDGWAAADEQAERAK
jgi:hypothetical protein